MERDKLAHLGGGLAVAAFSAVIGAVLLFFAGLHPLTVVVGMSGWIAGLSVEGTQREDNKTLVTQHEISFLDAAATAAPGLLMAAAFEVALRAGVI